MRAKSAKDQEIAALAADQRGVVSRSQLLSAGLSNATITRCAGSGRLVAVHRGVYAVGHRVLTTEGWWMAAVLAGGEGAVLSHATAAAVWELRRAGSEMVHITVPGDPGHKRRIDLADQRGLIDFRDFRAANSASLKAVLQNYRPAPTRRELEERFLALCDNHGIERPETNVLIEGILVDFVWRHRRLIMEVDATPTRARRCGSMPAWVAGAVR